MQHGEIWWVNFDPSQGSEIQKCRPAVILTINSINKARRTVAVVPLSTAATPRPPVVIPAPSAGQNSAAVCDQLRAIDKSRVLKRTGLLSTSDLAALSSAVKIVLGL
ncbi:MAG: type II toxin-antitoxin system PemK/MazF family toxin [Desulfovibrio sp.]|nr:type II toxin-antitoxin system PemK/MazF family toxin [Desulfovibrio sp.]